MKYVSLFAGIGGFDLALNRLGHECVYANDFDKYAAQTYEKNLGSERANLQHKRSCANIANTNGGRTCTHDYAIRVDTTSITDVPAESIPDHDLLVGGFPCQAFSVAGKRRGFDEVRGTLFFDIARILRHHQTKYFILENVKGLLSHDGGRTFRVIIKTLTELGYDLQWQVLNSKNFGVPQNRERVFIVGHLRGQPRPKIFPIGKSNTRDTSAQGESQSEGKRIRGNVASTLAARDYKGGNNLVQRIPLKFLNRNQRNIEGDYAYTVDSLNTGGVMITKPKILAHYGHINKPPVEMNISPTLKAQSHGHEPMVSDDMKIRRLTPIECERLQGFPDNWTQGVSDTQRYKQLGNAVTVNVVYEIAKRLST